MSSVTQIDVSKSKRKEDVHEFYNLDRIFTILSVIKTY